MTYTLIHRICLWLNILHALTTAASFPSRCQYKKRNHISSEEKLQLVGNMVLLKHVVMMKCLHEEGHRPISRNADIWQRDWSPLEMTNYNQLTSWALSQWNEAAAHLDEETLNPTKCSKHQGTHICNNTKTTEEEVSPPGMAQGRLPSPSRGPCADASTAPGEGAPHSIGRMVLMLWLIGVFAVFSLIFLFCFFPNITFMHHNVDK